MYRRYEPTFMTKSWKSKEMMKLWLKLPSCNQCFLCFCFRKPIKNKTEDKNWKEDSSNFLEWRISCGAQRQWFTQDASPLPTFSLFQMLFQLNPRLIARFFFPEIRHASLAILNLIKWGSTSLVLCIIPSSFWCQTHVLHLLFYWNQTRLCKKAA